MRKFDVNFRELGPDGKPAPPPAGVAGVVCRACGCKDLRVVEARGRPGKVCRHCGQRVVTRYVTQSR